MSPGAPQDSSGAQAAYQQNIQHDKIAAADTAINQAFSGFNDDYFNKYAKSYNAAYTPQVDDQYATARTNLVDALGKSGNLTSSYGASQLAALDKAARDHLGYIGTQAEDAADKLRGTVANNKSNLYNLAQTASEPGVAAAQAPVIASSLDTPVAVSPLGQIFSAFANIGSNAIQAQQAGFYGTGIPLFNANTNALTYTNKS